MYQLSKDADLDWQDILHYTYESFGERQVKIYTSALLKCLDNLSNETGLFKKLNIETHEVLSMQCKKHILFGLKQEGKPLLIIAIFHEKMDLMNRLRKRI